jgi:AcrR family transcriptional regulator
LLTPNAESYLHSGRSYYSGSRNCTTTREIAERADVGKGTLFTYARDKRELLMLIVNDELDALTETAFATLPKKASLLARLLHVFLPRYEFWGRDPALSRHVVHEVFAPFVNSGEDGPNGDDVTETARFRAREPRIVAQIAGLVGELQRAGTITSSEEPELIAQLFWDIYLSENRNWLATKSPDVPEGIRHLRRVLTLAIKGLEPKGGRFTGQFTDLVL